MKLALSKKAILAYTLHFFAVAGIIVCRSYIDLLFLSTYPRQWLPYLFMGQTGVTLAMALGLTKLISKGSRFINLALLTTAALLVIAARFAFPADTPGLAFGLCLFLAALAVLLGVISWNVVSDIFDIREFKKMAKWVGAAGSVGALVVGVAIPGLVAALSSESLLIVLAVLVVTTGGVAFFLSPEKNEPRASKKKKKGGATPTRYPLFRWLAAGVVLLMLVDVLADFSLKNQLAIAYDREQIAAFIGPFYGIASAVMLPVQFGLTDWILRKFGVGGLLAVVPVLCLFGGVGMIIAPGLWSAAALRFAENVGYYALYNVGREIAGTPLPSQARRSGKLFLKGVVTPTALGIGAVLLLGAELMGERGVAALVVLFCLGWLYVIRQTTRSYTKTLEEAVSTRRLGIAAHEVDEGAQHIGQDVVEHALSSQDPEVVLFGLGYLEKLGADRLPSAAVRHLDSESAEVRAAVATTALRLNDRHSTRALVNRLESENDPTVVWSLLEALAVVGAEEALQPASDLIRSDVPEIRGGALLVMLQAGDLDGIILAATTLREMLGAKDRAMRLAAARVIAGLRAGKLQKELESLIDDPDEAVATTAIRAVGERHVTALVPALTKRLGPGRVGRSAALALIRMGEDSISALVTMARNGPHTSRRAALRALIAIDSAKAESAVVELVRSSGVNLVTTAAHEVAHRARRKGISDEMRQAARELALEEIEVIGLLAAAEGCAEAPEALAIELKTRRILSQDQFLHWIAAATDAGSVLDVIPSVIGGAGHEVAPQRRAAAIELLDATIRDNNLRSALSAAMEPKEKLPWLRALGRLKDLDDPWITSLINNPTLSTQRIDENMDISQRALLLRKVDLFEALPGDVLVSIAEMTETREMTEGETIFAAGEAPDAFYIVASGSVRIIKEGATVADLKRPQFFGEIGLLDDSPRMADAVATADGVLVSMDREAFFQVTEDLPEVLRAVIRKLVQYLRSAEENDECSDRMSTYG